MEICLLLHLLGLLFCGFKYVKGIFVPASHMVHFPNHLEHFKGECINHQRDFCGKCNSVYKVHWWCQLAVQIYCTAYHLQDFWTAHVYQRDYCQKFSSATLSTPLWYEFVKTKVSVLGVKIRLWNKCIINLNWIVKNITLLHLTFTVS